MSAIVIRIMLRTRCEITSAIAPPVVFGEGRGGTPGTGRDRERHTSREPVGRRSRPRAAQRSRVPPACRGRCGRRGRGARRRRAHVPRREDRRGQSGADLTTPGEPRRPRGPAQRQRRARRPGSACRRLPGQRRARVAMAPASREVRRRSSVREPGRSETRSRENRSSQRGDKERQLARRDIAIVGVAGRYPRAKNVGELWRNLIEGKDCIGDIPAERYQLRLRHGNSLRYRGGFVDDDRQVRFVVLQYFSA